jgi:hypothetical protein
LDALLFALGPSLNGLLAQQAEFLEDALFGLIGFGGITSGVLDDIEKRLKLGLECRMAV